jgi:uncharacterized protein (TIGR03435 family)
VRIFTLIFMAVAGLTPVQAFAQKTDGGPTFEVAYKCRLDYLIEQAFDLQRFQIAGAPGWAHADRFNIEAKPPASAQSSQSNPNNPKLPPNRDQRQMLQALLVDRFHLKYTIESKGRSGVFTGEDQSGIKAHGSEG